MPRRRPPRDPLVAAAARDVLLRGLGVAEAAGLHQVGAQALRGEIARERREGRETGEPGDDGEEGSGDG